jgi:hypothetical protein
MVQAVSHRPVLTENWFQYRAGPCGVYGGHSDMGQVYGWHSDMGQVYLQMIRFSFVKIIELLLHTLFNLHTVGRNLCSCKQSHAKHWK